MDCSFIEQNVIQVDVTIYDEKQEELLLKYPSAKHISELISVPLEIPVAEFMTYYLFHKKRTAKTGWSSYDDIRWKIGRAYSDLEDFIIFNGKSIATAPDVEYQDSSITEYIGESIGLSVINRLHGLTNADWGKIPVQRGRGASRVLDYEIVHAASDGKFVIQVENKGSSVKDNAAKGSQISNHKANIDRKKGANTVNSHSTRLECHFVKYGTITAVDARPDSIVKCWLLDPPANLEQKDPKNLQLVNRNRFLFEWISLLSPRSQLASALGTRLAALEALEDPFELDGIPLKKGNGEEFSYEPYPFSWGHSSWMASKSKVTDGPAGGNVVQLLDKNLFFFGIREDLLALAANQKFNEILKYRADSGSITKKIECVISKDRFDRLHLPDEIREDAYLSGGYYHFEKSGQIHYSPEGIVFGVIPTFYSK